MIYSRPDTIISEINLPCIDVDNYNNKAMKIPPACGGLGGNDIHLKMIKELKPGDHIFNLENKSVLVKNTASYPYKGEVIKIILDQANQIIFVLPENLIFCKRRVTRISEIGQWGDIPKSHFMRARRLRTQSTPPEKKLWQYLRSEQLGIKFRSQHPINRYIVDFYARKAGLVVEVDGETAHTYLDQIKYDQERNNFMEGLGLKILRFSASDVMSNIEGVISEIMYHLREEVPDNFTNGQWRYAKNIKAGDKIYIGRKLSLSQVRAVRVVDLDCDVTIVELEGGDNFISDSFVFHI
jgi:very-short-patch-repair endonuclease